VIVVDTNVIAYLYLEGDYSKQAEELLLADPDWAAPILWRSEFQTVLALFIRRGWLSVAEAVEIMQEARRHMDGKEYEVAPSQVLQLVGKSTCSAYGCEFAALARNLNLPLVTADQQILEQFPQLAISLVEILKK
jgi:predicted nucleic acid-binding protein